MFPEDGLTGLEATNFAPEHIKSYTVPTVTLYSTPCTEAADQVQTLHVMRLNWFSCLFSLTYKYHTGDQGRYEPIIEMGRKIY